MNPGATQSDVLGVQAGRLFHLLLPPAFERLCDLFVLFGHLGEAVLPQALRARPVLLRCLPEIILARLLGLVLGRHLLLSRMWHGANRAGLCSATAGLAGPAPPSVYTARNIGRGSKQPLWKAGRATTLLAGLNLPAIAANISETGPARFPFPFTETCNPI
jgi:hypothetical protein